MRNGPDLIRATDPEVGEAVTKEIQMQQNNLVLTASGNFVSRAVMAALGSVFINTGAGKMPGRNNNGIGEYSDIVEKLAVERAKMLFGAQHVNVQPHSRSQAQIAVCFSVLNPGDTIFGVNIGCGGHIAQSSPVNILQKFFNLVAYDEEEETGRINYEKVFGKAFECKPKLIAVDVNVYPRVIDFIQLKEIADEVGAILMVDMTQISGLVAAGIHPSPVPHAAFVTSSTFGMLRGPEGGLILCREKYASAVDRTLSPGIQDDPLMPVIAAKAVAFKEALHPEFKAYQEQVVKNSSAMANALSQRGYNLVSGGTDNHLIVLDLRNKGITGKEAEEVLCRVGISVNKNAVPFDPQGPFITSGVGIGTPAVTGRGLKEQAMVKAVEIIDMAIANYNDEISLVQAREAVTGLCAEYPLFA